ncbi:hypothetical protein GCK32_013147, partial [Trichostrongylus colubriformis]
MEEQGFGYFVAVGIITIFHELAYAKCSFDGVGVKITILLRGVATVSIVTAGAPAQYVASKRSLKSSKPSTSSESENVASISSDARSPRRSSARLSVAGDEEYSSSTSSEINLQRVATNKHVTPTAQSHQHGRKLISRDLRSSPRKRIHSSDGDVVDGSEATHSTLVESSSASEYREEIVPTTSVSSLRRSARGPRPKRALSPTPASPKRRPRVKKTSLTLSQGDDLKENETTWTREKAGSNGNDHEDEVLHMTPRASLLST